MMMLFKNKNSVQDIYRLRIRYIYYFLNEIYNYIYLRQPPKYKRSWAGERIVETLIYNI